MVARGVVAWLKCILLGGERKIRKYVVEDSGCSLFSGKKAKTGAPIVPVGSAAEAGGTGADAGLVEAAQRTAQKLTHDVIALRTKLSALENAVVRQADESATFFRRMQDHNSILSQFAHKHNSDLHLDAIEPPREPGWLKDIRARLEAAEKEALAGIFISYGE